MLYLKMGKKGFYCGWGSFSGLWGVGSWVSGCMLGYNQTPVLIEYQLTASGKKFANVIDAMIEWGLDHRREVMEN